MTKSYRTPRIGGTKTHACEDIHEGRATVVTAIVNNQSGWVLPGGEFTRDRNKAIQVCKKIDLAMSRSYLAGLTTGGESHYDARLHV